MHTRETKSNLDSIECILNFLLSLAFGLMMGNESPNTIYNNIGTPTASAYCSFAFLSFMYCFSCLMRFTIPNTTILVRPRSLSHSTFNCSIINSTNHITILSSTLLACSVVACSVFTVVFVSKLMSCLWHVDSLLHWHFSVSSKCLSS